MLQSKARWRILDQDETAAQQLADELKLSIFVARLLVRRGINNVSSAKQFLLLEEPEFLDPFLLKGMKETIDRINDAIKKNERILVFGDYDADGVSSTSVLMTALRMHNADCDYYIPNRFTEGYGPNNPALKWAKEEGYKLVVTVDTGIAALDQAAYAKDIDLDFIITDHHEPPPVLPASFATINPKQPDCPYPFKELAGVGVAFKVAHALLGRVPDELLDFAVIGTIADLVPLVGENRLIAKKGLQALQSTSRPGLRALKDVCGIKKGVLDADHVGFGMGPRLNAAGRLDSADPAVELLMAEDFEEAKELADEIDRLNKDRQTIVNEMTEEAMQLVEQGNDLPHVIIVAQEGWNAGVIGIVASRLVERFYRPTIVMSIDPESRLAKGSARSIDGFDMFMELSKSRDILPHFGGHPMAAGMTLAAENIDLLQNRLNEQASMILTEEALVPVKEIDLLATVDDVTLDVLSQIEALAPFGVANTKPNVLIENASVAELKRIGSDSTHLKVQFTGDENQLDGIAFRKGHLFEEITPQAKLSAVGTLSINEWNGKVKPQILIDDLKVAQWQLFDWRSIKPNRLKERLEELPENTISVAFQPSTKERLKLNDSTVVYDPLTFLPDLSHSYLVILDVPNNRSDLEALFQSLAKPHRIYVVLSEAEESFFTTNPNRDQFKWYYAFLKKRKEISFNELRKLEQFKGWSAQTTTFMNTVFTELGFVHLETSTVKIVEQPEKKSLDQSRTFRNKQEQSWLENELVYASYQNLKACFDQLMHASVKKESMSNGL
ncbi:single-stranded-DNA-specific exonuclease [Alkalihalobacillus xiaoxiensis]|uniref:Single-stranded-DNA-specific exonuclease RecJ n=1 Tax=Shouchella xiaoxiensis TaxID=766895 RepID=A0ABS2SUS3_9BACI|nr:single-stranded-DNA-specific exonuclease RecJ [Shouchella xiaoxiensis]MBM7838002.1 single-stranded-DNA-specific exonuclease [Shouchella xiaoxiensis]